MGLEKLSISGIIDLYNRRNIDTGPTRALDIGTEKAAYTRTRGSLTSEDGVALSFQFNPEELRVNKRNVWQFRKYTGKQAVEPIWVGGDVEEISFKLMMDATAGSNYFSLGGKQGLNARDGTTSANTLRTLDSDRGTLNALETLRYFQYPIIDSTPRFTRGAAVPNEQFSAPPTITFTYGYLYLQAKLTDLSYAHKAFNNKLVPIRTEADITLTVMEGLILDTSINPTDITNPDAFIGPPLPPGF